MKIFLKTIWYIVFVVIISLYLWYNYNALKVFLFAVEKIETKPKIASIAFQTVIIKYRYSPLSPISNLFFGSNYKITNSEIHITFEPNTFDKVLFYYDYIPSPFLFDYSIFSFELIAWFALIGSLIYKSEEIFLL